MTPRPAAVLVAALLSAGCDAVLGIGPHQLADAATPFMPAPDAGPTGADDAASDAPAVPLQAGACGDSGACAFGGLLSVGRVPGDAGGAGVLPDGATVRLTDDGFELGGTTCDPSGTTCVTGGLTP